jgi:uncharacterized membrane protein YagU involved in acid resistance
VFRRTVHGVIFSYVFLFILCFVESTFKDFARLLFSDRYLFSVPLIMEFTLSDIEGTVWAWLVTLKWNDSRPVREGVSTDSLKFHPAPPSPTLLCPAGGPPPNGLQPSSSPLDTPSRTGLNDSELVFKRTVHGVIFSYVFSFILCFVESTSKDFAKTSQE